MTIDEATKLLKMSEQAIWLKGLEKEQRKAEDMAIKSLESWNAIREIFKAKSTSEDWEYIHDLQIWEDALEIIDKHLTEVSE